MTDKKLVGKITHYFSKIGVTVVELSDSIAVGDEISVEGATTKLIQKVESMQVEHAPVEKAKKGEAVGLKVNDVVRPGDAVFRVVRD